ncbi:hypothetical protein DRF59_06445 [Chryseobacterium flavum]|uniref:Type I restriction modification DNA specificity domain-containing protein n=1 Tax=Chryseobacterium flavum TaxID=415851 RepID=A0A3D9CQJ7_9FLAO|nr:hypothetical protein DRF59_06445 [Chryseobacterium flavum]
MGEIATFSKGKGISKNEIVDNGETECIRYGELYTFYEEVISEIKSKTNTDISSLVLSETNDVIIPASGETQIDIATASCVIKSGIALGGDLNIIKTKNNGIFLSYYLNSKKKLEIAKLSQGISVVHLYSSQLASLNLKFPQLEEQEKLSSFLSLLNFRIQTQKKIIEDLQITKKEISIKLFKEGFNSSESKKENFQKLGELTYIVNKKNKENLKLPVYSINNKKGFVSQSEQFEGIDSDERGYDISLYKIIGKETFAYNPARINVGSIGYSGNLENIIISSLYVCFKTTDTVDDEFLFQYLRTDIFRKEVLRNVEGGVRDYLFYENFSRIKINLPDLKEQIKIAKFLSKFDEKVNVEIELLTQYENQKKYLLQNLFV